MLSELIRLAGFRRLLFETSFADVRNRYAGSAFGLLWMVLFPLAQLSIYALLYVAIFKIRPAGLTEFEYVLMVFSGLVPLFIFNDGVTNAASGLLAHKTLLINTTFPMELIPVRAALAAQLPPMIGLVATLILGAILGRTGWLAVVAVPFFWLLLLGFVIGIGWLLSLISVVVRDVQHGMGLIIMMLIMLSPFAYTPEMVPQGMKFIILINPLTYFVLPFQSVICYDRWPDMQIFGGMVVLSLSAFFFGLNRFGRFKHAVADHV